MSAIWPTLACVLIYVWGYRVYARRLERRLFGVDDRRATPAHALRDDVDYLPTRRSVLFGHHFASITGLSPMLGPAIAVIWGWGPAMLWVVLGAVFIGCVHDFSALVVSARSRGSSIGSVAEEVIGARARRLFLAIIFFGIGLAMGVFTLVIAQLFAGRYGSAVIPSGGLMIAAAVIGWMVHRRGVPLAPLAALGFALQLGLVWVGVQNPVTWSDHRGWMLVLLAYAFAASVLPVWSLLQPRDFLNSLLLYFGLGLCYLGFFLAEPTFAAPFFQPEPRGAPAFFPFVFITIACGAASGFHALVSSGTTAKQLDRESHARPVAFGGMIGESVLGLLAVLATTVAVAGTAGGARSARQLWADHYVDWHGASALSATMERFIAGAASFTARIGVPQELGEGLVAVIVVSFALTTLDSATRLLRYNVEEIGASIGLPRLDRRGASSAIAVTAIGFFAFYEIDDRPAGLVLWAVFGSVNQLLAALTLLTVTIWLVKRGKSPWYTGLPMLFMMVTTLVAMVANLHEFSNGFRFVARADHAIPWPLLVVATAVAVLGIWLIGEAIAAWRRARRVRPRGEVGRA